MSVQDKLKKYINANTEYVYDLEMKENEQVINQMIKDLEQQVGKENLEDIDEKAFEDFMNFEVATQIFETNAEFLKWIYDEPDLYKSDVIDDIDLYGNIDMLVKAKMDNDWRYELRESNDTMSKAIVTFLF